MDTLTIVLTVIGSLLGVGLLVFIAELISHFAIPTIRDRYPDPAHKGGASLVYSNMYLTHIGELPMSQRFDEEKMQDVLKEPLAFVNHRQDCADFRLSVMLRLYRDFATELPVSVQTELKNAILGFRYWMTQPGQDSMCFWSENHQIIFASCEYMAGKTFPDQVFTVDGKTGVEHEAMAKARIEAWLDLRFTYGFSEWNSNNYFPETVTALLQLLSVTDDETLATRAKMVLDLLFFDVAQMGYQVEEAGRTYHTFIAPSARAYAHSKASDLAGNNLRPIIDMVFFGEEAKDAMFGWKEMVLERYGVAQRLLTGKMDAPVYTLPQIIKDIANTPCEMAMSSGLDLSELRAHGLVGADDRSIMFQLGMEAVSNPEIIENTLRFMGKNKMFCNRFIGMIKHVNFSLLRALHLLPALSKAVAKLPNGAALNRGNVYCYKTPHYAMATAQGYEPLSFGVQQHIWGVTISPNVSIFNAHPARNPGYTGSPNYWVGNGRTPYSYQYKGTNLSLYVLPSRKHISEREVCQYTHAYCPVQFFDEVNTDHLQEGSFFGRIGQTMVAMRTNGTLSFRPLEESISKDKAMIGRVRNTAYSAPYDLLCHAPTLRHFWATTMGVLGQTHHSFEAFVQAALTHQMQVEETQATYITKESKMTVGKGGLVYNQVSINTQYPRYRSPFIAGGEVEREPTRIEIRHQDAALILDFAAVSRRESAIREE